LAALRYRWRNRANLFGGRGEGQAVDQIFHFIVGTADYSDRDGIAVREHGQCGLTHDAAADVFVEVSANQSFCADGNVVGIFVEGETLGFRDLTSSARASGGREKVARRTLAPALEAAV
jgi:hypothetical protein